jgi:hypothetical protein
MIGERDILSIQCKMSLMGPPTAAQLVNSPSIAVMGDYLARLAIISARMFTDHYSETGVYLSIA